MPHKMAAGKRLPIAIVAACSKNRVIGVNGDLPWNIPEDRARMLALIKGGVVIHGRRVFEELQYKPLPNCHTVVLSKTRSFEGAGVHCLQTLTEAIDFAIELTSNKNEAGSVEEVIPNRIWILGGEQVYTDTMWKANRLFLTEVHIECEGDTYFPPWSDAFTSVVQQELSSDCNSGLNYTFWELAP